MNLDKSILTTQTVKAYINARFYIPTYTNIYIKVTFNRQGAERCVSNLSNHEAELVIHHKIITFVL